MNTNTHTHSYIHRNTFKVCGHIHTQMNRYLLKIHIKIICYVCVYVYVVCLYLWMDICFSVCEEWCFIYFFHGIKVPMERAEAEISRRYRETYILTLMKHEKKKKGPQDHKYCGLMSMRQIY